MAAVDNDWYSGPRQGNANKPLEALYNVPKPMDMHLLMSYNVVAKQAYESAMHLGYTTEQCYLAMILSLAGALDNATERIVKAAASAKGNPPKVVTDNDGKNIAIL